MKIFFRFVIPRVLSRFELSLQYDINNENLSFCNITWGFQVREFIDKSHFISKIWDILSTSTRFWKNQKPCIKILCKICYFLTPSVSTGFNLFHNIFEIKICWNDITFSFYLLNLPRKFLLLLHSLFNPV